MTLRTSTRRPAEQSPDRPGIVLTPTEELSPEGYRRFADQATSGRLKVDVWSRLSARRDGWEYLVCISGHALETHQVLNLDQPLSTVPNVDDVARLLVQAKLLKRTPIHGHRYAIAINGQNKGWHYANEELRERAIDELIIQGHARVGNDVSLFETDAHGQWPDRNRTIGVMSWIKNRALAGCCKDPSTRLRLSIQTFDTASAEAAIQAGASPNVGKDPIRMPPLMLAAIMGAHRIIAMMGEISPIPIEVDAKDANGDTALHIAVGGEDNESCLALLELGASLSALNGRGQTPLQAAAAMLENPVKDMLLAVLAKRAAQEAMEAIELEGAGADPMR